MEKGYAVYSMHSFKSDMNIFGRIYSNGYFLVAFSGYSFLGLTSNLTFIKKEKHLSRIQPGSYLVVSLQRDSFVYSFSSINKHPCLIWISYSIRPKS